MWCKWLPLALLWDAKGQDKAALSDDLGMRMICKYWSYWLQLYLILQRLFLLTLDLFLWVLFLCSHLWCDDIKFAHWQNDKTLRIQLNLYKWLEILEMQVRHLQACCWYCSCDYRELASCGWGCFMKGEALVKSHTCKTWVWQPVANATHLNSVTSHVAQLCFLSPAVMKYVVLKNKC